MSRSTPALPTLVAFVLTAIALVTVCGGRFSAPRAPGGSGAGHSAHTAPLIDRPPGLDGPGLAAPPNSLPRVHTSADQDVGGPTAGSASVAGGEVVGPARGERTISGVVVDSVGSAVPGATVQAFLRIGCNTGAGDLCGRLTAVASATADEQGRFAVSVARAAEHRVRATGPGLSSVGDGVPVPGGAASDDVRVEVAPCGRALLVLATVDGTPAPESVDVERSPLTRSRLPTTSVVVVRDGALVIEHLTEEEERVVVRAKGWTALVRLLSAPPGGEIDLGRVVLDHGRWLEGTVVDSRGCAVPGAIVTARLHPDPVDDGFLDFDGTTATDPFGGFALQGLPEARTGIGVQAKGCLDFRAVVDLGPDPPPMRIALTRLGVLVGVLRTSDLVPGRGFRIEMTAIEESRSGGVRWHTLWATHPDREGRFEQGLPPGGYRVVARDPGVEDREYVLGDVTIEDGEREVITFTLPR